MIFDVSKVCGVFIFRVKWSKKTGLLHPEDEDIAILPNVVIYPHVGRYITKHSNIHIYYLGGYYDLKSSNGKGKAVP